MCFFQNNRILLNSKKNYLLDFCFNKDTEQAEKIRQKDSLFQNEAIFLTFNILMKTLETLKVEFNLGRHLDILCFTAFFIFQL